MLLGGNNFQPYELVDDNCIKISRCQTTTGYIVAGHYLPTLINNIREGLKQLIHNPHQHKLYAIDQYWFSLQRNDNWFLITPHGAIQREGYSDIECKETNYKRVLSSVNKEFVSINGKQMLRINPTT